MSGTNGTGGTPLPGRHVGREQTITALDRQWTLARWDRAAWAEFFKWVATQIQDPRDAAMEWLQKIPDTSEMQSVKQKVVTEAIEQHQMYLSENNPKVQEILDSMFGASKILEILLRKNHPDEFPKVSTEASESLAYDIAMEVGIKLASDKLRGAAGVAPGPKGDAAASPDSPSSTQPPSESTGVKLTPISAVNSV